MNVHKQEHRTIEKQLYENVDHFKSSTKSAQKRLKKRSLKKTDEFSILWNDIKIRCMRKDERIRLALN